jgi:hypothetical protein
LGLHLPSSLQNAQKTEAEFRRTILTDLATADRDAAEAEDELTQGAGPAYKPPDGWINDTGSRYPTRQAKISGAGIPTRTDFPGRAGSLGSRRDLRNYSRSLWRVQTVIWPPRAFVMSAEGPGCVKTRKLSENGASDANFFASPSL